MNDKKLGTAAVRWDLSGFYSGLDDPRLEADVAAWERLARKFAAEFRGQIDARLGDALEADAELDMLSSRIGGYLHLMQSLNANDERVRSVSESIGRRMAAVSGDCLTFYSLELAALPENTVAHLAKCDQRVAHHLPLIKQTAVWRPHQLSEPVESALDKRSPFGAGTWSEFYDVMEADLRFLFGGKKMTLGQMTDLVAHHRDAAVRARAQKVLNGGLGGTFAKYSAQTLNVTAGLKSVEDRERGFSHPMSSRNLANLLPDAVVESLHSAVRDTGGPLAQRYYRLKAELLGKKTLLWSDRNAPLPFQSERKIPFAEAVEMVERSFRALSPTLGYMVAEFTKDGHIDAHPAEGKDSGAYNMTLVLPGRRAASFVLLNYRGTERDVMTLAHELGHGMHGLLAAAAQGPLMFRAPMAYAETASVFGEMTVFDRLRTEQAGRHDPRAALALLTGKIDDFMNTVIRQISFSNLERRIHAAAATGQRLSADEIDRAWLEVTREMYGADGEAFTYRDMEHLWTYISHFHRPFYVYSYATGELFTQGIYAKRAALGQKFEALYLDLLRAGGTKDATGLLAPFGLDPTRPDFWSDGIKASVGRWIEEAEALAETLDLPDAVRRAAKRKKRQAPNRNRR